jgi:hypothetical protein
MAEEKDFLSLSSILHRRRRVSMMKIISMSLRINYQELTTLQSAHTRLLCKAEHERRGEEEEKIFSFY